jgi:hypothetical protein
VDTTSNTKDKTAPLRTEGPMIRIQWILLSEKGVSLMMPTSAVVPEEISLAQLWDRHIVNRYKKQVSEVKWGKHYRTGAEIETGQVTDLQDNDSVEIIITAESSPSGQLEVQYVLEGEKVVNRLNVKSTATMGEIRARISQIHKSKPIQSLSFEGTALADEDSYSDWLTRLGGLPQIVARIVLMVQRKQMNVRVGTPKNEFLSLAMDSHCDCANRWQAVLPTGRGDILGGCYL